MKSKKIILGACAAAALLPTAVNAQILYSQNFDVNDTANWTVNNNNQGLNTANFTFDYSALGIPSAPNSGGSTIGLKLGANVSGTGPASGALPGISVSPTGQSFTGSYTLTFDWWQNWLGSATTGLSSSTGGSGSTQLSTFGILSSGTTANYAGAADGVFFGATGDGAASQDFRAYSSGVPAGYTTATANNVYAAGSQNNTASLYQTLFPAGNTAPAQQTAISATTQSGATLAGTAGFAWHQVAITYSGNIVTWSIDGTLIDTLDTTGLTLGGNNILFGMADTSLGAGTPGNIFEQLDFTLIDNIVVTAVPEPTTLALAALGATGLFLARRRNHKA